MLKDEIAFKQELILFTVLTPIAFYIGNSLLEILILIFVLILIMIVEIVNTSIEVVVDRIGQEHNELSGLAKDLGSAAVLMSIVFAVFVWVVIVVAN